MRTATMTMALAVLALFLAALALSLAALALIPPAHEGERHTCLPAAERAERIKAWVDGARASNDHAMASFLRDLPPACDATEGRD